MSDLFRSAVAAFLFLGCLAYPALALADDAGFDAAKLPDAAALDEDILGASRGTHGTYNFTTVSSDQTLNAASSGNAVVAFGNMTNGAITTGEGFGGSGIGSFVLNTGNNATINSGVSLSVLMLQ